MPSQLLVFFSLFFGKDMELSYASANKELIEMKHDLVNLNRELNRRDFLISVLKMKLEAYEVTVSYCMFFT